MASQKQSTKQDEQNLSSKPTSSDSGRASLARMTKNEPSTMEDLLAQTGYQPHGLKRGQQIDGVVSSITPHEILIDIGAKTEGVVLEKDKKLLKDLLSTLAVGSKVSAVVISPESEYGHPVLSLRREMMDKNWNTLLDKKEKGEGIDVVVIDVTRGGLLVEVMGLRGFIPLSHLDHADKSRRSGIGTEAGPESLIGKTINVKVIDLDRKERRIVLSQKGAGVDTVKLKALFEKIEIGKEYEGTVSGITNFGLFAKLNIDDESIEGLVHISEISWEKTDDINRLYKVGDPVLVAVIGLDKENFKLNLSIKHLTVDPWEKIAAAFAKDQTVGGKISKISSFGIFVSLADGVEGLIHKSKLPVDGQFTIGDKIECVVETVDAEKRRIALAPLLKAKPVGYR